MKIAVIAPSAPPKNSAESLQVARYVNLLQQANDVHLVTTLPESGWKAADASIQFNQAPSTTELKLPFHHWTSRVLASRLLRPFVMSDAMLWIRRYRHMVAKVVVEFNADLLYARATPYGALMLGCDVKAITGLPLVLHFSDPWADSPYRDGGLSVAAMEARCFEMADAITVTTSDIAEFYRAKYPNQKDRIFVSPNIPGEFSGSSTSDFFCDKKLNLLFAGSFYAHRQPHTFLQALEQLQNTLPDIANHLRVRFAGNAAPETLHAIKSCGFSDVAHIGSLPYADAINAQQAADALLSIDPDDNHPMNLAILSSKVVDYLALRRPLLALAPLTSVTAKLVEDCGGWTKSPGDVQGIAIALQQMVSEWQAGTLRDRIQNLPNEFQPSVVADELQQRFDAVLANSR